MTACLGRNLCEIATGSVTLMDGSIVCNACPEWRAECEARRLMTYPMLERRAALRERDKLRDAPAMVKLRQLMTKVHERSRIAPKPPTEVD